MISFFAIRNAHKNRVLKIRTRYLGTSKSEIPLPVKKYRLENRQLTTISQSYGFFYKGRTQFKHPYKKEIKEY